MGPNPPLYNESHTFSLITAAFIHSSQTFFTSLSQKHAAAHTQKHAEDTMAISQSRALFVAMAIVTIFALIGSSVAQESPAPAPAPTSAAGIATPTFAIGCAAAVASFVFGSALRI